MKRVFPFGFVKRKLKRFDSLLRGGRQYVVKDRLNI